MAVNKMNTVKVKSVKGAKGMAEAKGNRAGKKGFDLKGGNKVMKKTKAKVDLVKSAKGFAKSSGGRVKVTNKY